MTHIQSEEQSSRACFPESNLVLFRSSLWYERQGLYERSSTGVCHSFALFGWLCFPRLCFMWCHYESFRANGVKSHWMLLLTCKLSLPNCLVPPPRFVPPIEIVKRLLRRKLSRRTNERRSSSEY